MTHDCDAYSTIDFPEEEMIGESLQVDAASALLIEMKPPRIAGGQIYERVQFVPKLITQAIIYAVVMAQNVGNVPLNQWVENNLHFRRSS